ncbi:hypothetical protein [Streptomyces sp. NPDC002825]|uniref:Rv1733c family protein n=1 Tax=Streptomyces sp. NPDC002825 TaxID=3154666 RepID=UPI003332CA6C
MSVVMWAFGLWRICPAGVRERRDRRAPGDRLERPSDRLEQWLVRLLWILTAVAVPLASWFAANAAFEHYAEVRSAQLASRHAVTARLLVDADQHGSSRSDGARVPVEWAGNGGSHRMVARVAAGQREGEQVQIWLDAQGRVASPPIRPEVPLSASLASGIAAAAGTGFAAVVTRKTVHLALDRRRLVRWGREWERVEPRSTGRTV